MLTLEGLGGLVPKLKLEIEAASAIRFCLLKLFRMLRDPLFSPGGDVMSNVNPSIVFFRLIRCMELTINCYKTMWFRIVTHSVDFPFVENRGCFSWYQSHA